MTSAVASVLSGMLLWPAFAQEPSAKGVNFYSLEREIRLGQEAAATLARTLPIVHEPKLDAYLAKLGAELSSADPQFTYSFTIFEDRKPLGLQWVGMAMPADALAGRATEPVALPGGPIMVPMSLLAEAQDEAELAFQLAHAMAHIALRHATKLATRQELMAIATVPLQIQRTAGSRGTDILLANQDVAFEAGRLAFTRGFELQADTIATRMVASAGYDPESMVRYLEGTLGDVARSTKIFSPHPATDRRMKTVEVEEAKLPASIYTASTGEFDEIKALAAAVR